MKGLVAARKNGGTGGAFSFLLALAAEEQQEGEAPSSAAANGQNQWRGGERREDTKHSQRNNTPPYMQFFRGKSRLGIHSGEGGSLMSGNRVDRDGSTMHPGSVAEAREEKDGGAELLPKMFPLGNVHLLRRCGRKVERGRATS